VKNLISYHDNFGFLDDCKSVVVYLVVFANGLSLM